MKPPAPRACPLPHAPATGTPPSSRHDPAGRRPSRAPSASRTRTVLLPLVIALLLGTAPALQAGQDGTLHAIETDARDDVVRHPPDHARPLDHVDILEAGALWNGTTLVLWLEVASAPPPVGPGDHTQHQVLVDAWAGTGPLFPGDSGWDLAVTCIATEGADDCGMQGDDAMLQRAGWDGTRLWVTLLLDEARPPQHLAVGGTAAHMHRNEGNLWVGYDFTPNADPFQDLSETPAGDAAGGLRWWLLLPIAAVVGLVMGWRWRRVLERRR